MVELKRNLNDENHEKEAVSKTAEELRATVKKNEGDKIELNRALADTRQKCASKSYVLLLSYLFYYKMGVDTSKIMADMLISLLDRVFLINYI